MSSTSAYMIAWELEHLGDDEFDARLVRFEGCDNVVCLASPKEYVLPDQIRFEANFRTLARSDFPYTDVQWPIVSARMLDILLRIAPFSHRAIPVVMVDDTSAGIERSGFFGLQLTQHLDVLDWDESIVEISPYLPNRVDTVRKMILREPPGGFPPVFRVSAFPVPLFVSSEARRSLEQHNICGAIFVAADDQFRGR